MFSLGYCSGRTQRSRLDHAATRQPGCPLGVRGFASPPRSGFAFVVIRSVLLLLFSAGPSVIFRRGRPRGRARSGHPATVESEGGSQLSKGRFGLKQGVVVSFSGVDSAGKTTQIELVARALEDQGHRPIILWHRPGFSSALNLAKNLARRGVPSAMPTRDQPQRRARLFRRPMVRRPWIAIALVDTLVHFAVMVRLARLRADVVLCDRYLDDAGLDFKFGFPDEARLCARVLGLIRGISPQPKRSFLLMLPEEVTERRAAVRREEFVDDHAIRTRRYAAYAAIARRDDYIVINADRDRAEVSKAILSALNLPY